MYIEHDSSFIILDKKIEWRFGREVLLTTELCEAHGIHNPEAGISESMLSKRWDTDSTCSGAAAFWESKGDD